MAPAWQPYIRINIYVPGPQGTARGDQRWRDKVNNYDISKVRILVVDSSPVMQQLLKALLKALKVTDVQFFTSGREALSQMKLFSPDLVLADWLTDDMSGIDLVKEIRTGKMSPNPFISIIMMSGLSSYESIIEARNSGINEFLAKPISPKTLYEKICHVIERPRRFIRCSSYFGPDRRRKKAGEYPYPERRKAEKN